MDKNGESAPDQVSDSNSDAVSILSSDDEKEGNDVILVESEKKKNGHQKSQKSDVIHEIKSDSDDEDVEAVIEKYENDESVGKIKNNNSNTITLKDNNQKDILPTLTDDMHVVEVPSFIIPFLYEKPPAEPIKGALEQLAKAIEDEEKLEKEKKEKEKQDRKERRERGENLDESEVEEEEKKKKAEKKERRRRKKEDDDVSWDGESSSESEDELSGDEMNVAREKEIEDDVREVTEITSSKQESFFNTMLGKYFISIGSNLVQQYVQSDLLEHQKRKLKYEKKRGKDTVVTESSVMLLSSNLHASKIINRQYQFQILTCEHCNFKTESQLVLANHLEKPHLKNNIYHCNECDYKAKSANDVMIHMGLGHNIKAKLERPPSLHQCANCPFEDSGKAKLARHLIPCAKKFKPQTNLAPPIDWEPPAKIPKIVKPNVNLAANTYQNAFQRQLSSSTALNGPRPTVRPTVPSTVPTPRPPIQGVRILRPGTINHSTPTQNKQSPAISPVTRPQAPLGGPAKPAVKNIPNKGSFVICEICDGYIKDLEQLRNHMQWIHKVKINAKMIYNRPPLNCQKCQFRFFTDQGLERHLLGSHGLVTNSMQEAANRGKDGGRCPVCGRVYQWKLLSHVGRDHNMTLKPAHLSYKCTVCTATFGMYKLFENHVYSAHSVAAKKTANKNTTPVNSNNTNTAMKPINISDDVTITPHAAKSKVKK